mmetsp:Transcript_32903/g.83323  ORF Transcript_32903/g.83323 Transcript_32903/m.83323 type:complete len:258 (-) Transcript_32903:152-925(-)
MGSGEVCAELLDSTDNCWRKGEVHAGLLDPIGISCDIGETRSATRRLSEEEASATKLPPTACRLRVSASKLLHCLTLQGGASSGLRRGVLARRFGVSSAAGSSSGSVVVGERVTLELHVALDKFTAGSEPRGLPALAQRARMRQAAYAHESVKRLLAKPPRHADAHSPPLPSPPLVTTGTAGATRQELLSSAGRPRDLSTGNRPNEVAVATPRPNDTAAAAGTCLRIASASSNRCCTSDWACLIVFPRVALCHHHVG